MPLLTRSDITRLASDGHRDINQIVPRDLGWLLAGMHAEDAAKAGEEFLGGQ